MWFICSQNTIIIYTVSFRNPTRFLGRDCILVSRKSSVSGSRKKWFEDAKRDLHRDLRDETSRNFDPNRSQCQHNCVAGTIVFLSFYQKTFLSSRKLFELSKITNVLYEYKICFHQAMYQIPIIKWLRSNVISSERDSGRRPSPQLRHRRASCYIACTIVGHFCLI